MLTMEMLMIRMITVPEGIQPSEVGHHGSVESSCVRDQPFNEDFNNQFLKNNNKLFRNVENKRRIIIHIISKKTSPCVNSPGLDVSLKYKGLASVV